MWGRLLFFSTQKEGGPQKMVYEPNVGFRLKQKKSQILKQKAASLLQLLCGDELRWQLQTGTVACCVLSGGCAVCVLSILRRAALLQLQERPSGSALHDEKERMAVGAFKELDFVA
jgi:hypothetical protein